MNTSEHEFLSVRFSTEGLPQRDRLALWRDLFGREIVRVDMEPARDRLFRAEATLHQLSGLKVLSCAMSGGRYQRTSEFLADGNNDIAFIANLEGGVSAFQGGREVALQPGEGVALRMGEPAMTLHDADQFIVVRIPPTRLQPLMVKDAGVIMHRIRKENEALRLLLSYINALQTSLPADSSSIRALAATHIRDLVAVALGASCEGAAIAANGGVRAARLWAVKAYIDRHIEEPGLSITRIAASHGISPRYIQALFKDEGTTFSGFVCARRLARAHGLLANPQHHRRRIADIAFGVGFGDLSHFNRAFRRQYDLTPSDVRALALVSKETTAYGASARGR